MTTHSHAGCPLNSLAGPVRCQLSHGVESVVKYWQWKEAIRTYLREVSLRDETSADRARYPFAVPAIKTLGRLSFRSNVVFFVGENGSGKSTLLEAIAHQCGFHTAGGSRNNIYEVDAAGSTLGESIRLSWLPKVTQGFFFRAETFYQFASYIDRMDREEPGALISYGGHSLHQQSHGEAFIALFTHRLGSKAIYLLDEPEAALSPSRQLAFLKVIHDLKDTCQFIIATHSPILMAFPGAQILNFDTAPITEVSYDQTDHYQITRRFLERPSLYLDELLRSE
ncbi:MAG: AAA family ATPase [Mycobacterium leprae]